MQNKIIYSCDTSDEGSDMDVSDAEDNVQPTPHVDPPTRPHEGMVNNLSRHIQRDTLTKPRVAPRTTHVMKHAPVQHNPTSYASIASRPMVTSLHTYGQTFSWGANAIRPVEEKGQKNLRHKLSINPDEDEEGDSDDSFHTAPNSPCSYESDSEPAYQAPAYHVPPYQPPKTPKKVYKPTPEFEPGQLPDPPTANDMLSKMEELEKKLNANEDLAKQIRERLKHVGSEREQLRINRLKNQVHNSLARNRKSNVVQKGQATLVLDNNRTPTIAKSVDKGKAPMEPRVVDKGKGLAEPRIVDKGKGPAEPRFVDKGKAPDATPMDTTSDGSVHDDSMGEDTDGSRSYPSGSDDDDSDSDFVSSLHPVVPASLRVFPKNKKKKSKAEIRASQGSLEDAIIDKPLSKSYIDRDLVGDSPRALIGARRTKERKEIIIRKFETTISERDKELIKPDDKPYKGRQRSKAINFSNIKYRREARIYVKNRPLSYKEMRLMLLNLKDASVNEGTLSFQQEEFLKELVRRLIAVNHAILTIDEDHYNFALADRSPVPVNKSLTLGDQYFGDLHELDLNANDVSNYEAYKALRHFTELITHANMKKACQQLLETNPPYANGLRRLDPSDPNGDIAQDPDLPMRLMRLTDEIKQHTKIRKRMLRRDAKLLQAANSGKLSTKQKQSLQNVQPQLKIAQPQLKNTQPKKLKDTKKESPQQSLQIAQGGESSSSQPAVKFSRGQRKRRRRANRREESDIENDNTANRPRDLDAENDTLEREIDMMAYKITANLHGDKKRRVERLVSTEEGFEAKNDRCDIDLYLQAKGDPSKGAKVKVDPIPNPPKDAPPINIYKSTSSKPVASFNEPIATPPEPIKATPPIHPAPVPPTPQAGPSSSYRPYQSALSSLGLSNGSSSQAPTTSALCSAESAGGVCNVKNCPATHFKDFF